ncbi:DMP19 family protein [Sphingomonas sp. 2378]|uniref:DMP19 family protein n=1 Tax=Sphingomonas sp. 2378 TaxID=1219748 RepID=UPI00311AFFB4
MSGCRIEHILITRSEAVDADPSSACSCIGLFIEEAIERGYEEHELPLDAMRFAALLDYHGEVMNGGHAQYYMNKDEDLTNLQAASEMLSRIGLPQHAGLIGQYSKISSDSEDRIHEIYGEGSSDYYQKVAEIFYGIDDKFVELENSEGTLLTHLHDWVLQQSWVVVADAEGPASVDWIRRAIPDPPSRDERMAARFRRRHAENHGFNLALIHKVWRR